MIVALNDVELKQDATAESDSLSLDQGDVKWIAGGTAYTLTNTGKDPAQFVIFEIK